MAAGLVKPHRSPLFAMLTVSMCCMGGLIIYSTLPTGSDNNSNLSMQLLRNRPDPATVICSLPGTNPVVLLLQGHTQRHGADYTATAAHGGAPAVSMYEDTEFLTAALSKSRLSCAPGDVGLGLYEDTEFLPDGHRGAGSGAAAPDSPGPSGDAGGGLAIYEDTEFVGGGGATGGLGLYQDTEFLTSRFTNKQVVPAPAARRGLGAGLSRAGAAAAAQAAGVSDSTTGFLRMKENLPAHMLGSECSSADPSPRGSPEGEVMRFGNWASRASSDPACCTQPAEVGFSCTALTNIPCYQPHSVDVLERCRSLCASVIDMGLVKLCAEIYKQVR